MDKYFLHYTLLGKVISDKQMSINYNNKEIYHYSNNNIREIWEKTSFELEKKDILLLCTDGLHVSLSNIEIEESIEPVVA